MAGDYSAYPNTLKTDDVLVALDIEFAARFKQDMNRLMEVLGIVSPEVMRAGTAMHKYTISGSLGDPQAAEGDVIPLTKYTMTKVPIGELEVQFYRKLTTAQAILKSGLEGATLRQDAKMLSQIEDTIFSKFFTSLTTSGTNTATGKSLQDALAQGDAKLIDTLETNKDSSSNLVHFVNRFDAADYLGSANISLQTAYGLNYLETFLGVSNVILTNKVEKGKIVTTPSENLHLYTADFAELTRAGLPYAAYDGGLIGVYHTPQDDRASINTYVATASTLLAEITNYIVTTTITPTA